MNKSLTESKKAELLEKFEKGSYGKSNRAKAKDNKILWIMGYKPVELVN